MNILCLNSVCVSPTKIFVFPKSVFIFDTHSPILCPITLQKVAMAKECMLHAMVVVGKKLRTIFLALKAFQPSVKPYVSYYVWTMP